jgi:hypothetical protein
VHPKYGRYYTPKKDDGTFHFFTEDGSQIVYTYDLEGKEVEGAEFSISDYLPYLQRDCAGGSDVLARIATIDSNDLEKVAQLDGKSLCFYKNKQHPDLKATYGRYKELFESYPYQYEGEELLSFESFVDTYPVLFWKDGLGRFVSFGKKKYMEPLACEPIVYFYPEKDQQIEVSLDPKVRMMETHPKLSNQWQIVGYPDGSFQETGKPQRYQRLFWEGKAGYLPALQKGFVVKKEDVGVFLDEKLMLLGLNEKESREFKEAWLPELQEKEYCFIGFYSEETVNAYAPLNISPKPDRMIRILMDYNPLDQKEKVIPQVLQKAKPRHGFTVVEWGGIKR